MADVPLGRAVADGDLVTIRWTVADPADDVIADEGERRRHRLARLVAEAAAQGASPTDDDLAAALGVSRRTVLRDNQALAGAGRPLETRRRSRLEGESRAET